MNKEHWKIEIIRNLMKQMEEDGIKGSVTRSEKHDAERTIRFYSLGKGFERKRIVKEINDLQKQVVRDGSSYQILNELKAIVSGGSE